MLCTLQNTEVQKDISPQTPALELQKLSKVFGARSVLKDISFTLPQGAFLSIFGSNGAGKTTLLRILTTLIRPTRGEAHLFGFDIKENSDTLRRYIGFIAHEPMLYADLTALENLSFFGRLYGVENLDERAYELLEAVELLDRRFDELHTFSRGMMQRLAIARAFLHDPKLVFMDEPYSGLDPHAARILDALLKTGREKRTFVMASHNPEAAFSLATHVLLLDAGRMDMFAATNALEAADFLQHYRELISKQELYL